MNQYAKQFDVVRKIKAIVRLTERAIRARKHRNAISEEIARKIQRSAYDVSHTPKLEEYTPPYKLIAKQLQVRDVQIYKAAVYDLIEIAKQQAQYRDDILKTLNQQLKDNNVPQDVKEYVENKISEL
jgi:hypothetical protein